MKDVRISAVVLCKNESIRLERCLKALEWCDELILVDDYSDDGSAGIAKKMGARVYKRELGGDFAGQRNYALGKARGEWVLFVDADEVITVGLRKEIEKRIEDPSVNGIWVRRRFLRMGKELKHGEWGKSRVLRLGRKGCGKWQRKVHEFWEIRGTKAGLENRLLHFGHESLQEMIGVVSGQALLHAKANAREGKKSGIIKIILWPTGKFIRNYIWERGFMDGIQGLVMACVMSFHSFLAWSELWLEEKK